MNENLFVSTEYTSIGVLEPITMKVLENQHTLELDVAGTVVVTQTPKYIRVLDQLYQNTLRKYIQCIPYKYIARDIYLCFECVFRRRRLRRMFKVWLYNAHVS